MDLIQESTEEYSCPSLQKPREKPQKQDTPPPHKKKQKGRQRGGDDSQSISGMRQAFLKLAARRIVVCMM